MDGMLSICTTTKRSLTYQAIFYAHTMMETDLRELEALNSRECAEQKKNGKRPKDSPPLVIGSMEITQRLSASYNIIQHRIPFLGSQEMVPKSPPFIEGGVDQKCTDMNDLCYVFQIAPLNENL